jgi:multicomponent Na+:H+ antiporter subunit G
VIELLVAAMLLFGALLAAIAGLGLLRLPDVLIRMHSSTKAGTLGVGLILAATALHYGEPGPSFRALATIVFLLITAPVAAHMIARAAYRTRVPLWDHTVIDELRGTQADRRDAPAASGEPQTGAKGTLAVADHHTHPTDRGGSS